MMEYVPGTTLNERIEKAIGGRLSEQEAAKVF
jgi:hypothetical protein